MIKTEKVAPPKKAASEGDEESDESEEAEPVETRVAKFESNSSSLEAVNRAIVDMKNCRDSYEKSIRGVKVVLSNYNEWKADVGSVSERNYETVLAALAGDLAGINRRLGEFNQVKAELARKNDELNRSKSEIESLKQKNETTSKEIENYKAKIKELSSLLGGEDAIDEVMSEDNLPVLTSTKEVKKDTIGSILIDNKEWNYVITDLGNKKVAVGTELAIALADGTYLASGVVTKVENTVSLVEITRRANKEAIPVGAKVMVSANGSDKDESEE